MKLNLYVLIAALAIFAGALGFAYHAGGKANEAKWQKKIVSQQVGFGKEIEAYIARSHAAEAANKILNEKVTSLESEAENDPACRRLVDPEISKKLEGIR